MAACGLGLASIAGMRHSILPALAATACTASPITSTGEVAQAIVTTHDIHVYASGVIVPQTTTIDPGDRVRFIFQSVGDSVIPADGSGTDPYPAICSTPKAWVDTDPNNFAGPMPTAVSGIFALSPNAGDPGLVRKTSPTDPCGSDEQRGHVGNEWLCASGPTGVTMDETWSDPSLIGTVIRLNWSDVNPADGVYHFDVMLDEIDKAVANGKLFSIAIEAGRQGTPDWIFTTSVFQLGNQEIWIPRANGGGGVPRIKLQDSGPDNAGCGAEMYLGNPGNATYQLRYIQMLASLASTLKTNAARYRALAYVKVSGANLFTSENRLPKRCDAGCRCNTQVWSAAGYRPSGLEGFYADEEANIYYWFPGKTMSYELIQDGFPRVDECGGYQPATGNYIAGAGSGCPTTELPSHQQTEDIIDAGQATWTTSFAVQHNGLQPKPADCSVVGNPGCPNKWVVNAGASGTTGFQTQNIQEIDDNTKLESALDNALSNSTATFVEIYEERSWEARLAGGLLGSHTLAWWADQFHARRLGIPPALLPFVVISYTVTPQRYPFGPTGDQTLYFIHGAKCSATSSAWGKIVIHP